MVGIWLDSSCPDDNKAPLAPVVLSAASRIIGCALVITFMNSPVGALESLKAPVQEAKDVSQMSKAVSATACVMAGSICTTVGIKFAKYRGADMARVAADVVKRDPRIAPAIICGALIGWCAAKTSPI